jgi:hypothetical protein
MALSTSSVFHYTTSISTLYKILESSCFLPSYCKEKSSIDRSLSVRIPMVSFCDIPLTQTTGITGYGKFAIGLKMDWAKKKRLNPVFYLPEDSIVFERNLELLKMVNNHEKLTPLRKVVNNLNENGQFFYFLASILSPEVAQFNSSIKALPKEIIEPTSAKCIFIYFPKYKRI